MNDWENATTRAAITNDTDPGALCRALNQLRPGCDAGDAAHAANNRCRHAMTVTQNRLRFAVPLPPAELSPNARVGWQVRARHARRYGEIVAGAVRAHYGPALPAGFSRTVLDLTFVLPDSRRRDLDNLYAAFKAGQDAIVRLGLLPDDDAGHVVEVRLRVVHPSRPGRVIVLIAEVAT